MAKDFYDKLKIWSEVLKNNWPMIVLAFTALGSLGTNLNQYFGIQDKEVEIQQAHKQIENIANYYAKKPTKPVKCPDCGLKEHIKNHH